MFERRFCFVALMVCAAFGNALAQIKLDHDPGAAMREQVVANYERRKEHLEKLFIESKEKVENHESGREIMEEEEYKQLTKRIGLYERKLKTMEGPMDEREIERTIHRTKMRSERLHHTEL